MRVKLKLGRLSAAEQLFIYRRRKGLTQAKMSRKCHVSRVTYSSWELGTKEIVSLPVWMPKVYSDKLEDFEKCAILRRRACLEQEEIANELGVCRYWVNKMELAKEPCEILTEYWASRE